MKRFLCALFCILLLGGCTGEKPKEVENEPLNISGFNTTACTTLNGIKVSAEVECTSFDSLVLTFSEPETVKGTQIICNEGECTLKTEKMSLTLPEGKLPFNMLYSAIKDCIDSVNGTTGEISSENGLAEYTYNSENHLCKLLVNPDTKEFQKLIINGTECVIFENFTYKTN